MSYINHVLLIGLDQLRRHQAGEKVGKPIREQPVKTTGRRGVPTAIRHEIQLDERDNETIAKQFKISPETVRRIKLEGKYNDPF